MVKRLLKDIKTNLNIAVLLISFVIIICSIYIMLCGMQLYEQAEKFLQDMMDKFNEL